MRWGRWGPDHAPPPEDTGALLTACRPPLEPLRILRWVEPLAGGLRALSLRDADGLTYAALRLLDLHREAAIDGEWHRLPQGLVALWPLALEAVARRFGMTTGMAGPHLPLEALDVPPPSPPADEDRPRLRLHGQLAAPVIARERPRRRRRKRPMTDKDGYLINDLDWDREVAVQMATEDGLVLTETHWAILFMLRDHYTRTQLSPRVQEFARLVATQLGETDRRRLHRLFPQGPLRMAARYAGLPKPTGLL